MTLPSRSSRLFLFSFSVYSRLITAILAAAATSLPPGAVFLKGHTDLVYNIAFLPDQSTVVTACGDDELRVFDADTGALLRTFRAGDGGNFFCTAVLGPDRVSSGSSTGEVAV